MLFYLPGFKLKEHLPAVGTIKLFPIMGVIKILIIMALVKNLISQFNEETDWFTPLFLSTKKGKLWKGNLKTMLLDFFWKKYIC